MCVCVGGWVGVWVGVWVCVGVGVRASLLFQLCVASVRGKEEEAVNRVTQR